MKRGWRILLVSLMLAALPGCMDRIDLEDATLALMIGLDLNEKNELLVYVSSPVFNREAKVRSEEIAVKVDSIRQSRARFDEMVSGVTLSGKIQLIILGKRLVQSPDWFRLLDVVYRDARFNVNARMILYDGPVNRLFQKPPPTKARMSLHLTKLVDTSNRTNIAVKTTVEELHRQMYEKGMTPFITNLVHDKEIRVKGTALLSEQGIYTTVISGKETVYFNMFHTGKTGEISLTIPYPDEQEKKEVVKKRLSFFVKGVSKKVKTRYVDGRFQFDIDWKLRISISERQFPFDMEKDYKEMEKEIEKVLLRDFQKLVVKCQQLHVDPFGFGMYARAYAYPEWKKVQNDWPQAFAKATVRIVLHVAIKENGLIR